MTISSFNGLFSSRYQAGAPMTKGVEVALDSSELELDPAAMQARYVLSGTFLFSPNFWLEISENFRVKRKGFLPAIPSLHHHWLIKKRT